MPSRNRGRGCSASAEQVSRPGFRARDSNISRIRVPTNYINVAALLILWASLMRFFCSLFKPGPKKCPAQIMRFFFGGGGGFWGGVAPVC